MTSPVIVSKGSGYADDKSFEDFTVIAEPVANRDDRIFGQLAGKPGTGTCYSSYSLKLAVWANQVESGYKGVRGLYILVQHGGGTEVIRIPTFYDRGEFERMLLAMPERLQYATLKVIYQTASEADAVASERTRKKYSDAFANGRLKKTRRNKNGYCKVYIEPEPIKPGQPVTIQIGME